MTTVAEEQEVRKEIARRLVAEDPKEAKAIVSTLEEVLEMLPEIKNAVRLVEHQRTGNADSPGMSPEWHRIADEVEKHRRGLRRTIEKYGLYFI